MYVECMIGTSMFVPDLVKDSECLLEVLRSLLLRLSLDHELHKLREVH